MAFYYYPATFKFVIAREKQISSIYVLFVGRKQPGSKPQWYSRGCEADPYYDNSINFMLPKRATLLTPFTSATFPAFILIQKLLWMP